ncbi:MAG: c-type cytochrome [Planctomycetaceae bacterium]|nr:c-type cytochrome [Planctomycetaceae bacterium]
MRPRSITSVLFASIPLIGASNALAQNGDRAGETQPELPAEWRTSASPALDAAAEQATFAIRDGYRIELVAAEPLVEAPVAFRFGPDGRLWVVEMRGYMRDADGAGEDEPLGRIKVLEDTDGDGRMDRATVFLDGLVMPRGIAHWRDGLLVIEPPHLLFVRDTNNDGRADESRVLVPKHYAALHPSQKSFDGVPARAATDMRVHPSHLTPGVNRGYQKGVLKDGRLANFTGACSPHIHEGVAMTTDMDGCALICEPVGNLVHRYRLSERDGRIVATPADGDASFLTSTDERFRPVFAAAGPDGAIYLADIYRGVVQHRMFMTSFLRKQVEERGLEQPLDMGRIWRIVPKDGLHADDTPRNLAALSSEELVPLLASTEKPVRSTARRLLVERRDAKAIDAMRAVLASPDAGLLSATSSVPALETLWTLAGCGALDPETVGAVFASAEPILRVHALRAAERTLDSVSLASLLARAIDDDDAGVRVQAVLSSSRLDPPLRLAILEPALQRDVASRAMRSASIAVMAGIEGELLASIRDGRVLAEDGVGPRAFAAELTDALLDDGDGVPSPATLSLVLARASAVANERPWLAKAMIERVAARQRLSSKEPVQLIASCEPEGWFAMLSKPPAELALATPVDRNLFWPGREDVAFIAPKIARAEEMSFAEFGKRLYSNCMSCHQANGRGLPPVYPPLRARSSRS